MTRKIKCQICQNNQEVSSDKLANIDLIECNSCGMPLRPNADPLEQELPRLKIGDIVEIVHEQHVWNGEIAIIRAKKHKFYRIELFGSLIWIPEDWVKKNEPDNID